MEVIKMTGGPAMTNSYILFNEGEHEAIIIDPSCEAERTLAVLREEGLRLRAILLTHGHFDHIGSAEELRKKTGATLYVHESDDEKLPDPEKNMSTSFGMNITTAPADMVVGEGDFISEAGMTLYVMHTPGHTKGCVCYLAEDMIFSGDTLFNMSVGRTDFPDGSFDILENSLKKLLEIEGDPILYPGHGESTSLLFEKANNPFLSLL